MADANAPWIANVSTAPLTPRGDPALLVQRMLAITPATPAGDYKGGARASDTTDLPALVEQYGGDAAKAWAASAIGADALDALVAKHGATWFGALPKQARTLVAAQMAMLGAATSPRRAPTLAERADLAGDIEDQPWSDERKQNAYAELNTRIGLEAQRVKQAQDDAWEKGLGVADQLGARFISVNQLPPAVRTSLAPEALAALMLRADRNVHPAAVAAHGDVAMALNRMAARDPEAFGKQDLRLHRDEMTPAEYDALGRVQKAWGGYPPGAHGVTQQRIVERVAAGGLEQGPDPRLPVEQDRTVLRTSDGGENLDRSMSIGSSALSPLDSDHPAALIPAQYSRVKDKPASDEVPAWLKKQRKSILRSPIYVSSSDQDVYYAVRRMGNPDGWTIVYSHADARAGGQVYDHHRGEPHILMKASDIYLDLTRQPGYNPRAKILLTACYAANDTTARDLSAITHGVVYAAKGYVSEPSVKKDIYRLTVNNQYGEITGYAKFVDGVEVPSELLSLSYDVKTHSWTSRTLTKPAPVGDRSPTPGKEPWWWRMFH